jgi:hypothetical protein
MPRSSMLLLAILGGAAACQSDPSAPSPAPPAAILGASSSPLPDAVRTPHFLRPRAGAPTIANPTVKFWAKRGETRITFMLYHAERGQRDSVDFVRFKVGKSSLLTRPNGTRIAPGDSILITMKLIDPTNLIVDFQPAGLRFNPNDPAEIRMNFLETDPDLNHDGRVNRQDAILTSQLRIWREETATSPWTSLLSNLSIQTHEVEADVQGFTRYAVAY